MKLKIERFTIVSIAVILIALLLGLNTKTLPSRYPKTSVNYGKDTRTELWLYNARIGCFGQARHPGRFDNIDLRIIYREGTYHTSAQDVIESKRLGFLVPLLPYKNILILAIILICAVLISPVKEKFTQVAISHSITLYGLFQVLIGIYGAVFGYRRMWAELGRASFGGIILLPLYFLIWLTYILAIIAGIFILLRKRRAVILAICAQATLFFGFGYLLYRVIYITPGYRIAILNPLFYNVGYFLLLLFMIWLLTRPEARKDFRYSDTAKKIMPRNIRLIAMLNILIGCYVILFPIFLYMNKKAIYWVNYNPLHYILLGLVLVIIGTELLKLKKRARISQLIVVSVLLALTFITLYSAITRLLAKGIATKIDPHSLPVLIWGISVIWFLTRPKAKALFSPERGEAESKGAV